MTDVDVRAALHELAEPWSRGDRVKAAIDRAARAAGLSYWRAFDIWYGKARRIEPAEIARIQAALQRKNEERNRNELHEIRLRVARLEALFVQKDPEFHRPAADQGSRPIRPLGRAAGVPDRPLARKR